MEAVHFGAGNIGRGFIGLLLYQSGYDTTFVDVNDEIIRAINEKKQYSVVLAAEDKKTITVKNISAINSVSNPEEAARAIAEADIITTAVGPNVLPIISKLIAQGLRERVKTNKQPLNIIACENMVGGTKLLKENIYQHCTSEEKAILNEMIGFPNAAVDRIVPNQTNEELLQVLVEPYYEWVVEAPAIKGEKPPINGITFVEDLTPYIERKLFTVNTGHAAAAYVGYHLGYRTIIDAMKDVRVSDTIQGALRESGEALIQTYQFDREEHEKYIETILSRFTNPFISDEVTRVARGPLRKLGARDRLVRPAVMYMEATGKVPVYLAKVIAAALAFNHEADEEAVQLQEMIANQGVEATLQEISGLEAGHPLVASVLQEM
ncbi:mannitol-1-phosphate 5-dehydrogenase [Compostibacillus humi]|uniref:Mannitol-1-phosphate 5-dehydrogenase n=1 Tax=Compostibacillus humi TaxID=1245525 RepID=A0A8J2TP64_9BACI|nr:mannitol-1-phosphate 5-dehydrogenase [Compostibacillus humi]GFZ84780.1 mannitol-1-phosphate 5-dehydrogenase [Compostibacillus humi]